MYWREASAPIALGRYAASPAKLAEMPITPAVLDWLTEAMLQEAAPAASVVPVQLCAVAPAPSVKLTVRPATGAWSESRRTPERSAAFAFARCVCPVYEIEVAFGSGGGGGGAAPVTENVIVFAEGSIVPSPRYVAVSG